MPGHENASCGGWPQCANLSSPACGCLNYGWNHSDLAAFVREVEELGIEEIDVWRQVPISLLCYATLSLSLSLSLSRSLSEIDRRVAAGAHRVTLLPVIFPYKTERSGLPCRI